jgi:hypothetical protein
MPTTTPTLNQSRELTTHTTMKAITQAEYGLPDVLHLQDIQKPEVGDDDVFLRVHAAGVHIGDWHVMTGEPRLMRIMGFGFRAPKARVQAWMSQGLSNRLAGT